MDLETISHVFITQFRSRSQAELRWFKNQPDIDSAIQKAALAINSSGKRYSHQRRLTNSSLGQAHEVLSADATQIKNCTNFEELFDLVEILVKPIHGIGELYVYDTSLSSIIEATSHFVFSGFTFSVFLLGGFYAWPTVL